MSLVITTTELFTVITDSRAIPEVKYRAPTRHPEIPIIYLYYALLSKQFPHHHDLSPDLDVCIKISEHHERRNLDTLSANKYPLFLDIIQMCFKLEYSVAGEIVPELDKQQLG